MAEPALWQWRYALTPRGRPNARVTGAGARSGALIRDAGGGVGCVHPWPELGDPPLEVHLESLRTGLPTNLAEQALLCAEIDGLARREGRSLFGRLQIPRSHWTVLGTEPGEPARVAAEGFRSAKLKCGPDQSDALSRLDFWRVEAPELRFRLDFNETSTVSRILDFWRTLDEESRRMIDFLEDPVPWNADDWEALRKAGIPLAADRDAGVRSRAADWVILKPAVTRLTEPLERAVREGKRVAITTSMDHAIGQAYAAYRAAEWGSLFPERIEDCGLLTHECYENDEFFSLLERDGPILRTPVGTGLGFDHLIESLPWKPLI